MFLVVLVHTDFFSLEAPTLAELHTRPADAVIRILVESISIVCVNVFIMISGWFGIRPKVRSLTGFLFQCLFFLTGIYAVMLAAGAAELSLKGIAGCLFLTKWNWFPKAYLVLYMLSPVLNAFIEQAPRKQLRLVILFYFLFQTVYDWCSGATNYLAAGYSPLSFIGLYLLTRYVSVYRPRWASGSARTDFCVYLALTLVLTALPLLCAGAGEFLFNGVLGRMFIYSNPLVIASALFLLLTFSKLRLQSKAINWLAASSFAVFLMHSNPNVAEPYFVPLCRQLHASWGTAYFALILPVIAGFFLVSVLVDQVRIRVWLRIEQPVERLIKRCMEKL